MSLGAMTKKRGRRRDSKESYSSAGTAPSKAPTEVLELGQYLVRELGFEDGVDTLGRWMSHHLAELIDEAENGTTEAKRSKARKNATETIVKLWENRVSLPGNAYPLKRYEGVLTALDRLRSDNSPFLGIERPGLRPKQDELAADIFDGLARLIIVLLLMKLPIGKNVPKTEDSAAKALDPTEQQILTTLERWVALFSMLDDSSGPMRGAQESNEPAQLDLNEAAAQLVEGLLVDLHQLGRELRQSRPQAG